MIDINQKLLAAFRVEHVEHLEGIRSSLARWEQGGGNFEVDEPFRRAHSLKGAARVTGLAPVEALAHQLEGLFALLRGKSLAVDTEIAHLVHAALDCIEDSTAALLEDRLPPDASRVLDELNRLVSGSSAADGQGNLSALNGGPRADLAMDSCSPREGDPDTSPVDLSTPASPDVADPAPLSTKPTHRAASPTVETVRLSTENLDRLLQSTSQLLTESLQQDCLAGDLKSIHQQLSRIEQEWLSVKRTAAGPLRRLSATPETQGPGEIRRSGRA